MIKYQKQTKKQTKKPNVTAIVTLHSVSEDDFDVSNIQFVDAEFDRLMRDYGRLNAQLNGKPGREKELDKICTRLNYLNNLHDMALEDVGYYGPISEDINRELWQENQEERTYGVEISLWYTETRDCFGEVSNDVDFVYKVFFEMSVEGKILYDELDQYEA